MVKQFTINLNKGEGEQVVRVRKQERRAYLLLGLFALVFVVLGGLTWAQNLAMNDVIKTRTTKLNRIKFELDSLKREGTKVSKDDVMALANLETERFLWSHRLEKLSEILPPRMSLTGLQFQNKVLIINAIAQIDTSQKEFEVISKFVELLKGDPEFRKGMYSIQFDQSTRKKIEDQEILIFQVKCTTQDPDRKKKQTTTPATTSSTKLPAAVQM
jgi:Tfp pilus assembly protein PilN